MDKTDLKDPNISVTYQINVNYNNPIKWLIYIIKLNSAVKVVTLYWGEPHHMIMMRSTVQVKSVFLLDCLLV